MLVNGIITLIKVAATYLNTAEMKEPGCVFLGMLGKDVIRKYINITSNNNMIGSFLFKV